jgi:hypothetical protein
MVWVCWASFRWPRARSTAPRPRRLVHQTRSLLVPTASMIRSTSSPSSGDNSPAAWRYVFRSLSIYLSRFVLTPAGYDPFWNQKHASEARSGIKSTHFPRMFGIKSTHGDRHGVSDSDSGTGGNRYRRAHLMGLPPNSSPSRGGYALPFSRSTFSMACLIPCSAMLAIVSLGFQYAAAFFTRSANSGDKCTVSFCLPVLAIVSTLRSAFTARAIRGGFRSTCRPHRR